MQSSKGASRNADTRQFTTEVIFDEKHHATGEVEFKAGPGGLQNPEEIDENNWGRSLRVALSFGNFPNQLMLTKNVKTPVPAVDFANSNASVSGLFKQKQNIYVTPTEYFTTKYREIFRNTKMKQTTEKEARAWLGGPNMKYWP